MFERTAREWPRAKEDDFLRVSRRPDETWTVRRGTRQLVLLSFKLKSHAVAYARAISLSNKIVLFVDDRTGRAIRQSADSLTYPIVLE